MFIKSKLDMRACAIFCIVGFNARLILECLASNVKRMWKARCRQTNERWTGSNWNDW